MRACTPIGKVARGMIDMHAHYVSPSVVAQAVAGRLERIGVTYDRRQRAFKFGIEQARPLDPLLTSLDLRRQRIEASGIDTQVLSPWMDIGGFDTLADAQAVDWCRVVNDGLANDIAGDARFRGFGLLPVSCGKAAANELARCVTELSFAGGVLPTQIRGRNLDEAGLDELFETAAEFCVPIFIHPFRVMGADRLKEFFLNNICGNPFETTIAAMSLFFSGTFLRFPTLRVILSHCGGALPYIAGRAACASREVGSMRIRIESPDELLKCYFYDTVLHDPMALAFAITRVGCTRLVPGTDAPFGLGISDPVAHIRGALRIAGEDERSYATLTNMTPKRLISRS